VIIGVAKEIFPGERRVALVPGSIPALRKAGCEVLVESNAGYVAGYPDAAYREKAAVIVPERAELFARADVVFQLVGYGANTPTGRRDLPLFRRGQAVFGFLRALGNPEAIVELAATGAMAFAIEMLPRISRAQSMDALSSMSTVAGYKAVLLAADTLAKMFPMMMTAAGTLSPARVLVVGVGVSGLQAIATARRIGGVVSAYDVRPAAKEEVHSMGAKFIELPLDTQDADDASGYARPQDESFYRRQRELMAKAVADNDVIITTANVPGRKAPVLISEEMVAGMNPGSVIVDLAAERGGNCALTRAGERVEAHGVTVIGPVNIASSVPFHASQMYSSNVTNLFLHVAKAGTLTLDLDDEITRETLMARDGEVVHPRVREAAGLAPLAAGSA
jgi:proton-translocating NAD(P)+ transhydrogenase subunit alpha